MSKVTQDQQDTRSETLVSIVVPAYNEEEVIEEFYRRVADLAANVDESLELVFVNDGSTDRTLEILQNLKSKDERIAIVDLSRNFGKEIAMTAGLDHARGDAVVVIDADLQDPPELIPEMIEQWREGYDVVYAQRSSRRGESALKKATAYLYYRTIGKLSRVKIPADTGDFRLLSRRAVEALGQLREQHRFMKGLFAWIGFPQKAIRYERHARHDGYTKWKFRSLWNFAIEGITSFSIRPLKVATYIGAMIALGAFLFGLFLIIETLRHGNPVPGYPSLMVVVLFMGGVQLIALGIIGEYLGRMFDETKRRPLYFLNAYDAADIARDD